MSKPVKLRQGKYRVTNWPQYNRSLKSRGDLTIWFTEESIEAWLAGESACKTKGGQFKYSDLAIKTVYVIRQIFNLRLRQCEGLVKSLLKLLSVDLPTPDYTTVSRRIRKLSVDFVTNRPTGNINLILDSTGIKVVGEKEWINYKYNIQKQRKIWRKLHIGVTDDGNIIVGEINTLHDSDVATVPALLSQVQNSVDQVVGDGAYHKERVTNDLKKFEFTKNAKFVGPPGKGIKAYGNRLKVEETFSRYKRIIGNKFKAQNILGQINEAKISLFILNTMKDLGMPQTVRIA